MCVDVEDYVGGMHTIAIPVGIITESFIINITDNNIVECRESFNVTIVSVTGSGVTIGNIDNTEVIILDNDGKWIACIVIV